MSARDVLIRILTKGDTSGTEDVGKSLDQLAGKADALGKSLSLKVTAPLVGLGAISAKFAADANESSSKLEAVFGDRTQAINEWIAELRENVPATTAELQDLTSGIQDLLVPLGLADAEAEEMTKSVVTLAADLASFNNIPVDQALERIRSGLVGQYEPLLKFGVALNATKVKAEAFKQGIGDGIRELTASERALVSYQLILEGTSKAHGDAAKTKESDANAAKFLIKESKELATIMGQSLLPAITPVVSGLKDAAKAGQELDPAMQGVVVGLGAVAAAAGPALVGVGAFLRYRGAIQATTAAAGPWLVIAAATAAAYTAISVAANEAVEANRNFEQSIGLGDESIVEGILGAKSQDELDKGIRLAETKLFALKGTIEDQKKEIAEKGGFWTSSGILEGLIDNKLKEQLTLMEQQAAALEGAIAIGERRGAQLVEVNVTEAKIVEEIEAAGVAQADLVELTAAEKELREGTLDNIDLEIALQDAKIAGNETLIAQLEDQKREQIIINQLTKGGVDEATATAKAEELVKKSRQARDAEKQRNEAKRKGIQLTRDQAAAEGEAAEARKLRDGVRQEDFIDAGGKRKQRYIENGNVIGTSDDFPAPATHQSPVTTPNSSPQADLAPVAEAVQGTQIDVAPVLAAVTQMRAGLQSQIDQLAAQIQESGN